MRHPTTETRDSAGLSASFEILCSFYELITVKDQDAI